MKIIIKKKESENQQMVMRMNYRYITLEEQDEEGQYDWSIMIGLLTLFMTIFANVMLVAALLPGELAHVLILMPFVVPFM